ncbi:MAG: hypothetical protein GF334_04530 [Candidatus Altiarchaeales archaeon]|nr:hypothetical protein [Candidatus Altiarchaeales archaeon]
MPSRKKKESKTDIPLGKSFDVLDSVLTLIYSYAKRKYELEEKIEEIKEETEDRVEELREEATVAAYDAKKALLRTVIETIFLTTGILSLILGVLLIIRKYMPLEHVLVAYGLLIILVILVQMKTHPQYPRYKYEPMPRHRRH